MANSNPVGVGGALLGFYGAIKICEREGLDWRKVAELVAKEVNNGKKADGNAKRGRSRGRSD